MVRVGEFSDDVCDRLKLVFRLSLQCLLETYFATTHIYWSFAWISSRCEQMGEICTILIEIGLERQILIKPSDI
jgi:hypothetical protein